MCGFYVGITYICDMPRPIPIEKAKEIADSFGYDQIVIIGRACGENGLEHVTTYGKDKEHCKHASEIGDFVRFEIMKWKKEDVTEYKE